MEDIVQEGKDTPVEELVCQYCEGKLSEFGKLSATEQVNWVRTNTLEATRLLWYLQGKTR